MNDDVGNSYELSLVSCKCVGAYVRSKKNQNQVIGLFMFLATLLWYLSYDRIHIILFTKFQICWLWQKVSSDNDRGFQRFLDNVQYKSSGILRYERVFGQGFVSTGGLGMPFSHRVCIIFAVFMVLYLKFNVNSYTFPFLLYASEVSFLLLILFFCFDL